MQDTGKDREDPADLKYEVFCSIKEIQVSFMPHFLLLVRSVLCWFLVLVVSVREILTKSNDDSILWLSFEF